MCLKEQVWLSAIACWFCHAGLYLCSGVDLCEVVRVGTHHCAGCCVLKAAELSRGSSSGPMQTGICTLRCHSGLLQPHCWSRSGTPAGNDGGQCRDKVRDNDFGCVWLSISFGFYPLYQLILWHYWQYFRCQRSSLLGLICSKENDLIITTHLLL